MSDDSKQPEVLASVPSEIEANAILEVLQAAGIQAEKVGSFTAGFRAEAPGELQVVVHEDDLPKAKQVLAELREHGGDIDWSQVDVGQPEDE